jgi:hypothetical protein
MRCRSCIRHLVELGTAALARMQQCQFRSTLLRAPLARPDSLRREDRTRLCGARSGGPLYVRVPQVDVRGHRPAKDVRRTDQPRGSGGGRGIPLLIAIQSPFQLRERWGEAAAETVWNNSNVTVVFGGLKVDGDLQGISGLCGERDEHIRTHTRGASGHSVSRTPRRIPVMAPSQIRQIRNLQVLVLHRNTRPVIAKVRPVWKGRDVRGVPDPQPILGSALLGSLAGLLARPVPTASPAAALTAFDEDDQAVPVLGS